MAASHPWSNCYRHDFRLVGWARSIVGNGHAECDGGLGSSSALRITFGSENDVTRAERALDEDFQVGCLVAVKVDLDELS